jgi:hypothetical protein
MQQTEADRRDRARCLPALDPPEKPKAVRITQAIERRRDDSALLEPSDMSAEGVRVQRM